MSSISWSDMVRLRWRGLRTRLAARLHPPAQKHRTPPPARGCSEAGCLAGAGRRLGLVVLYLLVLCAIFVAPRWFTVGAKDNPEPGISFSCRQARYLGDDCAS